MKRKELRKVIITYMLLWQNALSRLYVCICSSGIVCARIYDLGLPPENNRPKQANGITTQPHYLHASGRLTTDEKYGENQDYQDVTSVYR